MGSGLSDAYADVDPRVFLRLPLEERRRLMALQAVGADLYSVGSEALDWLEQAKDEVLIPADARRIKTRLAKAQLEPKIPLSEVMTRLGMS